MFPTLVHQTSPTGSLSWEERRYRDRLRAMLPNWRFHLWSDIDNHDLIEAHYPEYTKQYDKLSFGVMRADIARYVYMHAFGGLYVDTDYRFVRPPFVSGARPISMLPIEEGMPGSDDFKLGNALLASTSSHPFWDDLIRRIFDANRPEDCRSRDQIVATTGPVALTNVYLKSWANDASIWLPERHVFYPDRRFFGLSHNGSQETTGYHQCWGSWRGKRSIQSMRNLARRKLNGLV